MRWGTRFNAALLATVLVGALRNARRRSVDLAEQASIAHEALASYAQDEEFVTGQLVCIDLSPGTARIANAGHPAPIRIRDGRAERVAVMRICRFPPRRLRVTASSSSGYGRATGSSFSPTGCPNAPPQPSTPCRS
jgi:Stage II sporulation protein E (SpoIIE)